MRMYFRLARGIGVSLPWWLAFPLLLLWCTALAAVVLAVALVWLIALPFKLWAPRRAQREAGPGAARGEAGPRIMRSPGDSL